MKLIKKKEDLIVGKHYWVRTQKEINGQTCSLVYKCEYLLNSDKWVGIDDVDFFASHDIVGPIPDVSVPDFDSYVQEYEKEQRYTRKYHTDVIGLSIEKRTKVIEDWEKEFLPEIRMEVFEMFKRRIETELKELAELLRKKDVPGYQIKDHILSNLNEILVREFKLYKDIYDVDISLMSDEEHDISDLSELVNKFFYVQTIADQFAVTSICVFETEFYNKIKNGLVGIVKVQPLFSPRVKLKHHLQYLEKGLN